MANRLLIIEDDSNLATALSNHYKNKGWSLEVVDCTASAKLQIIDYDFEPQVIIADLELSMEDDVKELQAYTDDAEWIFIVNDDDKKDITWIEDLAYDYLTKPLDEKRIHILVNRALRSHLTRKRLHTYSNSKLERYQLEAIVGKSAPIKALKGMLKQLFEVPISTLIITGETGTGKGLIARILHHCGQRSDGPIIELNCAALPKDLLESQLFGHEAGAFTGAKGRHKGLFEQANSGTLFLDEIGDMDIELQSKLLKAIEDQKIRRLGSERETPINVQIMAATSIDLVTGIQNGTFREDLYHRLSVFRITLPTLRERKDDLVELVPRIVSEYNTKANKKIEIIPDAVWEKLLNYDWPGNIRELRNVIERSVLLSTDDSFPEQWLQLFQPNIAQHNNVSDFDANASQQKEKPSVMLTLPIDGSITLDEMERQIIQAALENSDHNVSEAAKVLGTTRETLRYRIQKYNIHASS
ncbi:sigma-54 dependent transcriptional regulator [Oceanicoccus sp. KOV_DT_Chl]|uniref:sigma-54-dependent transcriptional regulator n=1 Tax=Oceanicoccus sp. KOV_DT_Chl TaxID=1904639 RepID=UPI000C7BA9C4|nr:sigma-54 dependent transcriptional regulator [Oceanicoccus sp. KOV_DT_Chl]